MALVFNRIFFPSYNPTIGTLLAFGTYAVGAIMRPLGGVFFGHYGDRIGRKTTLVWTLGTMGSATVLIGLLPTYARIGIAAPILLLLLRSLQGAAFGGEWAGAALVAVEHAPDRKTGIVGSGAARQSKNPRGLRCAQPILRPLVLLQPRLSDWPVDVYVDRVLYAHQLLGDRSILREQLRRECSRRVGQCALQRGGSVAVLRGRRVGHIRHAAVGKVLALDFDRSELRLQVDQIRESRADQGIIGVPHLADRTH